MRRVVKATFELFRRNQASAIIASVLNRTCTLQACPPKRDPSRQGEHGRGGDAGWRGRATLAKARGIFGIIASSSNAFTRTDDGLLLAWTRSFVLKLWRYRICSGRREIRTAPI